jgi:hypothetical protein
MSDLFHRNYPVEGSGKTDLWGSFAAAEIGFSILLHADRRFR